MLIGLLILLGPIILFAMSLPFSRRLKSNLCRIYRIVGGLVVIGGSATSLYLAAYTGDQGGIAAYFFQLLVILSYVVFSVGLIILHKIRTLRDS